LGKDHARGEGKNFLVFQRECKKKNALLEKQMLPRPKIKKKRKKTIARKRRKEATTTKGCFRTGENREKKKKRKKGREIPKTGGM